MALSKKFSRKSVIILLTLLVVFVVAMLEVTNKTHFFHKAAKVSAPSKKIKELPVSSKNSGNKNPSGGASINTEGTATDKNGQVPSGVSSDPSQWSTSSSRLITVKAPLRNSTFKSGDIVTGSTSVSDTVQYRLVDDQQGVIAQGSISVVNGNFTASIEFNHYGNGGNLDIFTIDQNGRETNEVQILLKF